MSRFRSIRLLCVAGAVGVSVAGVLALIYYYRRKKKPQKPPPVMQKWPYWKFCRKQGSLPNSMRNTRLPGYRRDRIASALENSVRDSAYNPLYPDDAVFFFLVCCPISQLNPPIENLERFTLWCYSFLRHTATPCYSFEAADVRRFVEVFLLNEILVISVEKVESVELMVFTLKESEGTFPQFLRKIQLEDVPRWNFGAEGFRWVECYENECYVVRQMVRFIAVLKYEIDSARNIGHCVLRTLLRIDENWSVCRFSGLRDSLLIKIRERNPSNFSQPKWIQYERKSGDLKYVSVEEVMSTHVVNWKHHRSIKDTLETLERDNNIQPSPYSGSHGSVGSTMRTIRELRLLCSEEQAEDTDQNTEEGKKNRKKLNLYTLESEPKTLKTLALSALLKNSPRIKDLSEKKMKKLGIPPDLAHSLQQHKKRESDPCIDLGQM